MSQQQPKLQELSEQAAGLLTEEVCQQYEPAQELSDQCEELEGKWQELNERLQLSLQDVEEKVPHFFLPSLIV